MITKDIYLAAFIKMNGFHIEVVKKDKIGYFSLPDESLGLVSTFYTDDNKLLTYVHTIRNLKSQIENMESTKEVN